MNVNQLIDFIVSHTGLLVHSGPFAGMKIVKGTSWAMNDRPSKLLGTYEQELHPFLYKFMSRDYDCAVDVGCAEGYYAVGLAKVFPTTKILAYDTSPAAKIICRQNADLNDVGDRVIIGDLCDSAELIKISQSHTYPFIFCDCESYEKQLFSQRKTRQALACADLIIECHDFMIPGTTAYLLDAFKETHQVTAVYAGGRNPNVFPFLAGIPDLERWRAVCEYRPKLMNWIICESRRS